MSFIVGQATTSLPPPAPKLAKKLPPSHRKQSKHRLNGKPFQSSDLAKSRTFLKALVEFLPEFPALETPENLFFKFKNWKGLELTPTFLGLALREMAGKGKITRHELTRSKYRYSSKVEK